MARHEAAFTQASVTRAIKAVIKAGIEVGSVAISPDGSINIQVAAKMTEIVPSTAFDQWKAKRDARKAQGVK